MDKFKKNFTLPIVKVDNEQRMVYGFASTPDIDSDGEIIKVEAFEKALPEYLKFPTLREMHQAKAIGTTKQAEVTAKGLYIGSKVVDDNAWKLVKEGVLTAFSVGGNVKKRIGNTIHELELVEISLVDVPANKQAVIELWKGGKFTKNASTAYTVANLMMSVKSTKEWFEYLGKDTKELEKCLNMLKSLLSTEALEPEPEKDNESESVFYGKNVEDLQKKIKALEAMDFGGDKLANALRKGVIIGMQKTEEELKKEAEVKAAAEAAETPEQKAEREAAEKEAADKAKAEADAAEAKKKEEEAAAAAASAGKGEVAEMLKNVEAALAKLAPAKEEKTVSTDLAKSVGAIAGSLVKLTEVVTDLAGKVAMLQKTPAAIKSKTAVVFKENATGEEVAPVITEEAKKLIDSKKSRLAELTKIFNTIGANEYANQGHSKEAGQLIDDLAKLGVRYQAE